jgi:hypothetical protein
MNLSMKTLYMLAYWWALAKEPDLPYDEITGQVRIITDYLDFVWKYKGSKGAKSRKQTLSSLSSNGEL